MTPGSLRADLHSTIGGSLKTRLMATIFAVVALCRDFQLFSAASSCRGTVAGSVLQMWQHLLLIGPTTGSGQCGPRLLPVLRTAAAPPHPLAPAGRERRPMISMPSEVSRSTRESPRGLRT